MILEYGSNNANSLIPILADLVEELEKRPLLDKVWAGLLNTFQTDEFSSNFLYNKREILADAAY